MLEAVVAVALRAVCAGIVLGAVLGLLALAAARALRLTAATRHALWIAVLIALVVMPLAGIGTSLARTSEAPVPAWHGRDPAAEAPVPQAAHGASGDTAQAQGTGWTPRVPRILALALAGGWALGALAGLLNLVTSVVRLRALRRRSSPLDGALADELPWLTQAGSGREIYVRLSYETETPVAIGFRRPVVLIPTELATADGLTAIEPLVLHEHAHLRRYDDWTNLAQRAIERIFWFNPLVWLVGRRIALEREIAADDAVVARTGAAKAYADSLWRLAREMRMPDHTLVAPGALLTRKQISVRIERLLDANRAGLRRSPAAALGIATVGALAVLLVATSAPAIELPPQARAPAAWIATSPNRHFGIDGTKLKLRGTGLRDVLANCTGCDFSHADLHGQDLHGIALAGVDLSHADLHDANLAGVRFSAVDLSGANLAGADLTGARFDSCDLSGVELRGARTGGMRLHESALD